MAGHRALVLLLVVLGATPGAQADEPEPRTIPIDRTWQVLVQDGQPLPPDQALRRAGKLLGTWKLRVNDNAGGDVGYINSWSITF